MAVLVISYSRADQPQVRAVVSLLQTAMRGFEKAVFWDGDLEPGELWFDELKAHIGEAPQLFVFWCHHSSHSEQVRREFLYAFECKKAVIPVLLDDTPLAPELAPIHGIDLRGAIRHVAAPSNLPSAKSRTPGGWWIGLAAAVVVLGLMLPLFMTRGASTVPSTPVGQPMPEVTPPSPPGPDTPGPPPTTPAVDPTTSATPISPLIPVAGAVLLTVGAVVVIRRRRAQQRIVREFASFLK